MYASHYGHAPVLHAPPRPGVRPPRKGVCRHCGQKGTPARGSPMHAEQNMPPPPGPPQLPAGLLAMQQAGQGGPPPGAMPPGPPEMQG